MSNEGTPGVYCDVAMNVVTNLERASGDARVDPVEIVYARRLLVLALHDLVVGCVFKALEYRSGNFAHTGT